MNKTMKILFRILLFLAAILPAIPAFASDLSIITEHVPPHNYEKNGQATGIFTDLFLQMAERADLNVERKDIQVWPWARGYQEIQKKPNVILFSVAKNEDRENMFQWIGPIMPLKSVMIARSGCHVQDHDFRSDLSRLCIGTVRNNASEQFLIKQGAQLKNLQRVHDLGLNIKKLMEGRIDAAVGIEGSLRYTARAMKYDFDEFEVVHTLFAADLYYAASKDMDPAIMARLQKAFDELKADGTVKAIINDYLH